MGADASIVRANVELSNGLTTTARNAGTYTERILSLSFDNGTVGNNYDIDFSTTETYIINRRDITISVLDISSNKYVYDGTVQHPLDYVGNYSITSGSLASGEYLKIGINYSGDCLNAKTFNYSYISSLNELSGSNNVLSNYDISTGTTEGSFTIGKRSYVLSYSTIVAANADITSSSIVQMTGTPLVNGDIISDITVTINGKIFTLAQMNSLPAGTYTITNVSITIKNSSGNTVTSNYKNASQVYPSVRFE